MTTRGEVPLLWNQARALLQDFYLTDEWGQITNESCFFFCCFFPRQFYCANAAKATSSSRRLRGNRRSKRSGRLRLCHSFDLDIPHNARGSDQIQKWQTIWGETSQDILVATWKVSVSSKLQTKHFAILFICAFFINTENFAKDNFFIYQTPGMISTALKAKSCPTMGTILPTSLLLAAQTWFDLSVLSATVEINSDRKSRISLSS